MSIPIDLSQMITAGQQASAVLDLAKARARARLAAHVSALRAVHITVGGVVAQSVDQCEDSRSTSSGAQRCVVCREMTSERIDRAERKIAASAGDLYRAFLEPELLEKWLPPSGMSGKVHAIDATRGGGYVMSLYHEEATPVVAGKTSDREDSFRVVFDELKPGEQVVQRVVFDTSDPSFTGAMRQTWTLSAAGKTTNVSVACENVPAGIRPEDHAVGLNSSLENLALAFEADS